MPVCPTGHSEKKEIWTTETPSYLPSVISCSQIETNLSRLCFWAVCEKLWDVQPAHGYAWRCLLPCDHHANQQGASSMLTKRVLSTDALGLQDPNNSGEHRLLTCLV